jgi:predicted GNAT family acetyltransferase
MTCEILTLADLVDSAYLALFIRNKLCKPGSDFQWKLTRLLHKEAEPTASDGSIGLVLDQGEVVGWARTEQWSSYDTLEAFVAPEYRLRGIAAFAASGLYAGVLHDNGGTVAVFHPHMLVVAKRAGFYAKLYEKNPRGVWVLA